MPGDRTVTGTTAGASRREPVAQFDWIMVAALLSAVMFLLAAILPAPLVMISLSALFVIAGFASAAALYLSGSRLGQDRHRAWEIAALLLFLGFAAAMLADTREVLAVLDLPQSGTATASSK
jgi:hypothetical protein